MKKPTWLSASTVLKTIYMTPSVVFMAMMGYTAIVPALTSDTLGPWHFILGLIISSIIGILGLLAVFIVDTIRNKKNQNKKTRRLSYFLHIGIPVIWFVAVTVFLFVIIYSGAELKYIFNGFSRAYLIGFLCLVAALIVDRKHKENRITPDYLLYSLYFAVPVIWFIILFFLIINNMTLSFF